MRKNKYCSHRDKNEVRISKGVFIKNVILYCILEIVSLWISLRFAREAAILAVILPIFCLFFVLQFINGTIEYNEKGVIFITIFNKKRFYPWNEIVSAEDTYENPKVAKGSLGRVLKIGYKNYNGEVEYKKYEYKALAGVSEFLDFYLKHKEREER